METQSTIELFNIKAIFLCNIKDKQHHLTIKIYRKKIIILINNPYKTAQ